MRTSALLSSLHQTRGIIRSSWGGFRIVPYAISAIRTISWLGLYGCTGNIGLGSSDSRRYGRWVQVNAPYGMMTMLGYDGQGQRRLLAHRDGTNAADSFACDNLVSKALDAALTTFSAMPRHSSAAASTADLRALDHTLVTLGGPDAYPCGRHSPRRRKHKDL